MRTKMGLARSMPFAIGFLLCFGGAALAQEQGPPKPPKPFDLKELPIPQFYKDRLDKAPAEIKEKLKALQEKLASKQPTFAVGYTTAMDKPLEKLAGTRIPANFLEDAKKQNSLALEALALIRGKSAQSQAATSVCSPAAAHFDWRDYGKVTPVKDQGSCGDCWNFSAMGTYEGSYSIRNNRSVNVSEQHALSCSRAGTCDGGWYGPVFSWMLTTGATDEASLPYHGADEPCPPHVKHLYWSSVWGFVSDSTSIPTVAQIKQAICDHGPVSVAVDATSAFQAYTGGVFNENDPGDINHAVVLVGWDEATGSWILRNSWGTGWGENGYMRISYQSNKVGYAAGWVEALNSDVSSSEDVINKLRDLLKKHGIVLPSNFDPKQFLKVPPKPAQ